jgi:hypothetical protein
LQASLEREVWFPRYPHELLSGRRPVLRPEKGVIAAMGV